MQARKYIESLKNILTTKIKILSLLTVSLFLILFLFLYNTGKKNIPYAIPPLYLANERLAQNEFTKEFIFKNGVAYTNYFFSDSSLTTDNRILSESQGLLMEYAVYTRDNKLFEKNYTFLKKHMRLKNGLFSWEYNDKTDFSSSSSATIDDLRIFRSLVYANSLWGGYEKDIRYLEKGLSQTLKEDYLTDFWENGRISNNISIRYIDITALKMLAQMNNKYSETLYKSTELLKNSNVSDNNFFSYDTYNIDHNQYIKTDSIDALNSLITIYNRFLAGINIDGEFLFLKNIFYRDKGIYSLYNSKGIPISDTKSTAIYSYLKLIAINMKDYKFLEDIDKELSLLLSDNLLPVSQFGRRLYSFDLLTLLLSSLEEEKDEQRD